MGVPQIEQGGASLAIVLRIRLRIVVDRFIGFRRSAACRASGWDDRGMVTRWWSAAPGQAAERGDFQKTPGSATALTAVTCVVLGIGVLILIAWATGSDRADSVVMWGTSIVVCGLLGLFVRLAWSAWRTESRMQTMAICEAMAGSRDSSPTTD